MFKLGVTGEEGFGCALQVNVLAAGKLVARVSYLVWHLNPLPPFESPLSYLREILWFECKNNGVWNFVKMFMVCLFGL